MIPKPEALELYRKSNQEFKCELVEEKAIEPMVSFLHHRKIHRFLPRPAHSVHRAHQGVQADERRRRLLEGPGRQSADAAHLRRVLLRSEGARRISAQARRSQAPRPSPARRRARSFQHSGRSRPGPDLLASRRARIIRKQMEDWLRDELLAPRLRSRRHAAHHAPRSVEDQRPREFLSRKYVRPDGSRKSRLPAQAHELPGPHSDLQVAPAQLSRAARAPRRARHRLSLRALRRAARPAARARLHAGRRAHLLHARADRRGNSGLRRVRLGSAARLRIQRLRGRAFRRRSFASGKLYRLSRRLEARRGRAHQHARAHERPVQIHSGRSRVLRPEDRRKARRRDRPPVAAQHRAIRFQSAAALRAGIRRRRWQRAISR